MSENLYNFLSEQGDYTKSYEDFQTQFASQYSIQKLHNFMSEKGDYTKSLDDFNTQFFNIQSQSKDFSSELPEITSEITALGEKQGIQRLNKMFKGLGWEFKQLPYSKGGFGFDRVVAISPPDANGNRKEQMFEFDLDLGIPAIGKSKNKEGDNDISGDFWESS